MHVFLAPESDTADFAPRNGRGYGYGYGYEYLQFITTRIQKKDSVRVFRKTTTTVRPVLNIGSQERLIIHRDVLFDRVKTGVDRVNDRLVRLADAVAAPAIG